MPLLERLLALRLGWILIRLGVVVCLVISAASPASAGILSEDSDIGLEDSEVEPEKESEGELAPESLTSPPPLYAGLPTVTRLRGRPSSRTSAATRRRPAYNARAPPRS